MDKISPIGSPFSKISPLDIWLKEIQDHPAWYRHELTIDQAEALLVKSTAGVYIISGISNHNPPYYTLHWVNSKNMVLHCLFHRDKGKNQWSYRNLQDSDQPTLDALISKITMAMEPANSTLKLQSFNKNA